MAMSISSSISIPERNQQILQMRMEGVSRKEVARRFGLSPERISQLEKRDQAEKSMAERRANLRGRIRTADDPERMWPVSDLADAICLTGATKNRLLDHFVEAGKRQICLRELMDMCLAGPVDRWGFRTPPLLKICGIGKYGFGCVVNGLTDMDLSRRCNEEWRKRLAKVKLQSGIM
jgi:transcriptional regulator with XRE-family HTH domain